jgi:hypothetical protein
MPKEILVDVSELEAPEPFEQVINAVLQLNAGEYICMLHRKKPLPLIQWLQEQGFACVFKTELQNHWNIYIWNTKDSLVNDYCLSLISNNSVKN